MKEGNSKKESFRLLGVRSDHPLLLHGGLDHGAAVEAGHRFQHRGALPSHAPGRPHDWRCGNIATFLLLFSSISVILVVNA